MAAGPHTDSVNDVITRALRECAGGALVVPPAEVAARHVALASASWRSLEAAGGTDAGPAYVAVPPLDRRDRAARAAGSLGETLARMPRRTLAWGVLVAAVIATLFAAAVVPAVHDPFAATVRGTMDAVFGGDEPAATIPAPAPRSTGGGAAQAGDEDGPKISGSLYGNRSSSGQRGSGSSGGTSSGSSTSSATSGTSSSAGSGTAGSSTGSGGSSSGSSGGGSGSSSSCPPGQVGAPNGHGGTTCSAPGDDQGNGNQGWNVGAGAH